MTNLEEVIEHCTNRIRQLNLSENLVERVGDKAVFSMLRYEVESVLRIATNPAPETE